MSFLTDPKNGPTKQTVTQNQVAPYVEEAQKRLLNAGNNILTPFLNTPSYTVAGLTPDHTMGFDLARSMAERAFSGPSATSWNAGETNTGPAAGAEFVSVAPTERASFTSGGPGALAQWAGAGPVSLADAHQAEATAMGPAAQTQFQAGQAAQLDPNAYKPFMNPYQNEVVDTTLAKMRQENDRAQAQIGASAAASGAFGGSREAVRRGMQDQSFTDAVASTTAQLMARGYDQATAQAMANTQMRQATGLQNTQLGTQVGLANTGATNDQRKFDAANATDVSKTNAAARNTIGLSNQKAWNDTAQFDAAQRNAMGLANAKAAQDEASQRNAMGLANAKIGNDQASLYFSKLNDANMFNAGQANTLSNANAGRALQAEALRNEMLGAEQNRQKSALAALLGIGDQQRGVAQQSLDVPFTSLQRLASVTPGQYANTRTETAPNTAQSPLQSLLGIGTGILGLPVAGANSGGSLGGNLLSGIFSDRREKTDIERIGKDPETGINLYAYRYKSDSKSYPKVVGPMAQDVEKAYPGSTKEIGPKGATRMIIMGDA